MKLINLEKEHMPKIEREWLFCVVGGRYTVEAVGGERLDVRVLARFEAEVQGERFCFVLYKSIDSLTFTLAEFYSSKRIAKIDSESLKKWRGEIDYEKSGRAALEAVIAKHGEPRVRSVLAGA